MTTGNPCPHGILRHKQRCDECACSESEIRDSIRCMRNRFETGEWTVRSAPCRLSLDQSEALLAMLDEARKDLDQTHTALSLCDDRAQRLENESAQLNPQLSEWREKAEALAALTVAMLEWPDGFDGASPHESADADRILSARIRRERAEAWDEAADLADKIPDGDWVSSQGGLIKKRNPYLVDDDSNKKDESK